MSDFSSLLGAAEFNPSWLKKKTPAAASSPASNDAAAASPPPKPPVSNTQTVTAEKKFSADAPAFKPKLSPEAPVFHPKAAPAPQKKEAVKIIESMTIEQLLSVSKKSTFNLAAQSFTPGGGVSKAVVLARTPNLVAINEDDPMILRDNWSLYFIDRSLVTEQCFEPILVFRMDCVEEFWKVFNNIPEASEMPPQSTYYFFRQDVAPKWEDERNRHGGCWQIRIKSSDMDTLDGVWIRLCCRTIGESWGAEDHKDSVNGLVLKQRDRFHILQIWVSEKKEGFPRDVLSAVQDVLPSFDIDYFEHTTLREHSVAGQKQKKKAAKRKF